MARATTATRSRRRKPRDTSPTHHLKMKSKDPTNSLGWSRVGVGWLNERGNVTLKLSPGIVLDWSFFTSDYSLILVPADDYGEELGEGTPF